MIDPGWAGAEIGFLPFRTLELRGTIWGSERIVKWEYQVIAKTDLAGFVECLNRLGAEGWEAISGTYTIGQATRVSVGGGATTQRPGTAQWVAVMKRVKSP